MKGKIPIARPLSFYRVIALGLATCATVAFGAEPPDTPCNILPPDGATNQPLLPSLVSSRFNDPDSNEVHQSSQWQLNSTDSFATVVWDSGDDAAHLTNVTVTVTLAQSNVYHWRVRYKYTPAGTTWNWQWTPFSTATWFETWFNRAPPETPYNILPPDGAVGQSVLPWLAASAFNDPDSNEWHSASQWQVSETDAFDTVAWDSGESGAATNVHVPVVFQPMNTYFWRVRYKATPIGTTWGWVWGGFSAATWFMTGTNEAPDAPLGVQATDGIYTDRVVVTWCGVSNANRYAVFRNESNDTATATTLVEETTELTCADLSATADTLYYYWVKAGNDVGWGPFSTPDTGGYALTGAIHYVSLDGGQEWPYLTWGGAATNIQDAVDVAIDGDMVVVSNGVYQPGAVVTVDKAVTLSSYAGKEETVVDGQSAHGCFLLNGMCELDGFMVTNGYAENGGGVYCSGDAVVRNCTLVGNHASYQGGGVYNGTVTNCEIVGNSSWHGGGGTCWGTVNKCTIAGNNGGAFDGSGTRYSTVNNCLIIGNHTYGAGATCLGTVNNCVIINNTALFPCAGTLGGIVNNCTISGNSPGGALSCTLNNCTIVNNTGGYCGGTENSTVNNCIVWGNTGSLSNNYYNSSLSYSCTTPMPPGEGNISTDPAFVGAVAGNYHLASWSPCINKGTNDYAPMPFDLDDGPRIVNGIVDMGCYEFCFIGSFIDITNEPATVRYEVATFTIGGTNSPLTEVTNLLVGSMWWTNECDTGVSPVSGVLPATNSWTIPGIPLAYGSNCITVLGSNELGWIGSDSIVILRTPPFFLDVTNTDMTVGYDVTHCVVAGTNTTDIVGDMWVTNASIGGTAIGFARSGLEFTTVPVALQVGGNVIRVYGSNAAEFISRDSVLITREPGPPFVDVTNDAVAVSYYSPGFSVSGTNNAYVVGDMWVTNPAAGGAAQSFPATAGWTAPAIALAVGTNAIAVYGTNALGALSGDTVEVMRATAALPPVCTLDARDPLIAPENIGPANGWTISNVTPVLTATVFRASYPGETHFASQWLVSLTSSFVTTVWDSGQNTTNLTVIIVPSGVLDMDMSYWWHVRHKNYAGGWSPWSTGTVFTVMPEPAGLLVLVLGLLALRWRAGGTGREPMDRTGRHGLSATSAVFTACLMVTCAATICNAEGIVSNVFAVQRAGEKILDITYDLHGASTDLFDIAVAGTTNGGATFDMPITNISGAVLSVAPGTNKHIAWNAGIDWNHQWTTNLSVLLVAQNKSMVLIPAGFFTMGNDTNRFPELYSAELPLHSVYISAFYMDKHEVSYTLWSNVYAWAVTHSYTFDNAGSGKTNTHPVHTVNWYDCVKWCNARSEMEGRTPCYYTSAALSTVYRTGALNLSKNWVNWVANGYRLPTEAEWEKAARGGTSGHRFPWSDADTIQHARANYYSSTSYAYDTSPTRGYHPTFNDAVSPYTSPAGYFEANGYGLYDMAGNVSEWTWDWYGSAWYSNAGATQSDTRGPTSGTFRVLRGGNWNAVAVYSRCAVRYNYYPDVTYGVIGFRCARGL